MMGLTDGEQRRVHVRHARSPELDKKRRWPPGARRLVLALLIPAVVLTIVGMVLLWPRDVPEAAGGDGPTNVNGEIVAVEPAACPALPEGEELPPGMAGPCGTVTVRLDDGTNVNTDVPAGPGAIEVSPGDDVVLLHVEDALGPTYSIMDFQRSTSLWLIVAAFAFAVIAFGRWRGLTALAGLGLTFAVLLLFIVPAILDGRSPLLVAIVGAAAIMLTVLYLTHGVNPTATVAVVGTLVSLSITAALSAAATALTRLSGIADETSSYLNITQGGVKMHGLLLAGIVIGSLGVLDDVTVTQSATVSELAAANPGYGFRRLYGAATRIGRAHIAAVINTIILAYAGASLPLLLLFATGGTPNRRTADQPADRAGGGAQRRRHHRLISAVPITTALAALLATAHHRSPTPEPASVPSPRPVDTDPWTAFVERPRP